MILTTLKHKLNFMLIMLMMTGLAFPAATYAQDDGEITPEPTVIVIDDGSIEPGELDFVDENPDNPLEVAIDTLSKDLYAVVYTGAAAGFVVVLTSFSKRIPGLSSFKSAHLALFYMCIAWGLYIVANYGGYTGQLDEFFTAFEQIGFILLGVSGTPAIYTSLYKANKQADTPIIGYSKHESDNDN